MSDVRDLAKRDGIKVFIWIVFILSMISINARFSIDLLFSEVLLISLLVGAVIDHVVNLVWGRKNEDK